MVDTPAAIVHDALAEAQEQELQQQQQAGEEGEEPEQPLPPACQQAIDGACLLRSLACFY